jgi:hypothetical protein
MIRFIRATGNLVLISMLVGLGFLYAGVEELLLCGGRDREDMLEGGGSDLMLGGYSGFTS